MLISLSVHLRFLLPHTVDAGCQLDSGEWVRVVGWGIRDVGDHGGSAVDVAEGLPQQHCQFAVPAGHIYIVISKRHSNIFKKKYNKGKKEEL